MRISKHDFIRIKIRQALTVVSFLAVAQFSTTHEAQAFGINQIGLAGGKVVPLSDQYIAFLNPITVGVEALGELSLLGPGYRFHSMVQFNRNPFRTVTSGAYNQILFTVGAKVGGIIHGAKSSHGHSGDGFHMAPTFSLLAGGGVDWLTLPGYNQTYNFSAGGVVQVIPGIEFPITDTLSGAVTFPVQGLFFSRVYFAWNGLLHLRMSL